MNYSLEKVVNLPPLASIPADSAIPGRSTFRLPVSPPCSVLSLTNTQTHTDTHETESSSSSSALLATLPCPPCRENLLLPSRDYHTKTSVPPCLRRKKPAPKVRLPKIHRNRNETTRGTTFTNTRTNVEPFFNRGKPGNGKEKGPGAKFFARSTKHNLLARFFFFPLDEG